MIWNKCIDSVPNCDRIVICYHDSSMFLGFYEDEIWRDLEWIDWKVTHWMEMPKFPEE